MRLKYRLLLAMATIVVAALLAAGFFVSREFEAQTHADAKGELKTAHDVFEAFHQIRYRLLLADCRVVAQAPVLRALVSTPGTSRATLEDSAQEMSQVVGSSLFMLVNPQGTVLASVARPQMVGRSLAADPVFRGAISGSQASGFWSEGGKLYQVAAVSLRFDDAIYGALILGHEIDGKVAEELSALTGSMVAFFQAGRLMADSLPGASEPETTRAAIQGLVGARRAAWEKQGPTNEPFEAELAGEPCLVLRTPLPGPTSGERGRVLIVKGLEHAIAVSQKLTRYLTLVGAVALFFALLFSILGARAVVVPIQELVDTTRAIASGDLSRRVAVKSADEVGELAASFDEMVGKLEASTAEIVAARDYIDNVLRSMSDSLVVIEPDGTIRTTNQATVDLLGHPREALIGHHFSMVLADGGQSLGGAKLFAALEQGVTNRELNYLTHSGESIPVTFSASPVRDPFGKPIGVVGVARDLRQILTLQQELAHREKLASLGQLAAGLAHEIRNPLAVIRFASGYLQKNTSAVTTARPERISQSFTDIASEIQRMGDLIDELLTFSKRPTPEVGGVDLAEVLSELEQVLKKRDEIGEVKLAVTSEPDLPRLHVAREPLRRILLNLTINALQAMGGKGSLTVRAWPQTKNGVTGASLAVADTGPGIPPEIQVKVFDPFFTTKRSGTGLGLFICSQTIHGMGGTIDLDTEVGRGTTFTLWMRPRTDAVV